MAPLTPSQEEYQIVVDASQITLNADCYPGIVRALETFFQLFEKGVDGTGIVIPRIIRDRPVYSYRGVMLDSSRHFLSTATIKQAIDGCMMNKLNILHWHITDDDSFPLELEGVDLNRSTFNNQFYSREQVKEIVRYGLARGVRVVPELDTPSHSGSWQQAFNDSQSFMRCEGIFGQMDPTLDSTYSAMQTVFAQVLALFPDPLLHLGGDEVQQSCWDQRPAIKQFMEQHGLPDYNALELYYRRRQKQVLRALTNRTLLYWANSLKELDWYQEDDVAHWWDGIGDNDGANGSALRSAKRVVLSYFDKSYLSAGYPGGAGIATWRRLYENRLGFPWASAEVLGAEAALWSEVSSDRTASQKLWMRAASLSERLWNPALYGGQPDYRSVVGRLAAQQARMRARGLRCAPLTVQLCELSPEACFPG